MAGVTDDVLSDENSEGNTSEHQFSAQNHNNSSEEHITDLQQSHHTRQINNQYPIQVTRGNNNIQVTRGNNNIQVTRGNSSTAVNFTDGDEVETNVTRSYNESDHNDIMVFIPNSTGIQPLPPRDTDEGDLEEDTGNDVADEQQSLVLERQNEDDDGTLINSDHLMRDQSELSNVTHTFDIDDENSVKPVFRKKINCSFFIMSTIVAILSILIVGLIVYTIIIHTYIIPQEHPSNNVPISEYTFICENSTTKVSKPMIETVTLYLRWDHIMAAQRNENINVTWRTFNSAALHLDDQGHIIKINTNGTFLFHLSFNINFRREMKDTKSDTDRFKTLVCMRNNRYSEKCQRYFLPANTAGTLSIHSVLSLFEHDYIWVSVLGANYLYFSDSANYLSITKLNR